MTLYEAKKPTMDARVDDYLGDSISYIPAGATVPLGGASGTITGFLMLHGDEGGMDGVDPATQRWYAKIHKDKLPTRPSRADRLTGPKLNNRPYQPAASTPASAGDYWLFDIQKV